MANPGASALPSYDRPPVIEVVCGMQFEPLERFQATSFGLLWQRFRDEYPYVEQNPPLAPLTEQYGVAAASEHQIEFSNVLPMPRVFFVHSEQNWLVQVQPDRLLHNWRKAQATDSYPRFPAVFERFWTAWERFLAFCKDEDLSAPSVNQLEVTYINHIVQEDGWSGLGAIHEVFPDLCWREQRSFLPSPESMAWKTAFSLPDHSGRLHVSLRHALRRDDDKPVLLCELTARGMPQASDADSLRAWFHLGREWIVRGFADLTSDAIQRAVWGRSE